MQTKLSTTFRTVAALAIASTVTLATGPLRAKTVYVPFTTDVDLADIGLSTEVWISNTGNKAASFSTYFIPALADGTQRDAGAQPDTTRIAAGATKLLKPSIQPGTVGMLEIDGDDGIVASSRLVGDHPFFGAGLGAGVPVISMENLIPAGEEADILGWQREPDKVLTDFGLINLGQDASQCTVRVYRGNAEQIQGTVLLTLQPLSNVFFPDALAILQQPEISNVRLSVSCDQDFYPFSTVRDLETGEVRFLAPSARAAAGLDPPGPGGDPAPSCAGGADVCFSKEGTFFTPTVRDDYRRVSVPVPAGSYSSLHFRVEVFNGGWTAPTSGLNLCFWLAKAGRHFNLYGFAGFKGPNRNTILFRHGIGIPAGDKAKFEDHFVSTPGKTYIFDYVYNPAQRILDLKILDPDGKVLHEIRDKPNVKSIDISAGEDITADFSNVLGANANEPPSYGWHYSNFLLEVFK